MNPKSKKALMRLLIPIIFIILYVAAVALLALYSDIHEDTSFWDWNYPTYLFFVAILTAPPVFVLFSVIFWVVEFIRYKQYRYEKNYLILPSVVSGVLFLIGVLTFFFFTLPIFG